MDPHYQASKRMQQGQRSKIVERLAKIKIVNETIHTNSTLNSKVSQLLCSITRQSFCYITHVCMLKKQRKSRIMNVNVQLLP